MNWYFVFSFKLKKDVNRIRFQKSFPGPTEGQHIVTLYGFLPEMERALAVNGSDFSV